MVCGSNFGVKGFPDRGYGVCPPSGPTILLRYIPASHGPILPLVHAFLPINPSGCNSVDEAAFESPGMVPVPEVGWVGGETVQEKTIQPMEGKHTLQTRGETFVASLTTNPTAKGSPTPNREGEQRRPGLVLRLIYIHCITHLQACE